MKTFLSTNWYKLITAVAMLLFAFGFSVFALKYNAAKAGTPNTKTPAEKNEVPEKWLVSCGNSIYEITYNKDDLPRYKMNSLFKPKQ